MKRKIDLIIFALEIYIFEVLTPIQSQSHPHIINLVHFEIKTPRNNYAACPKKYIFRLELKRILHFEQLHLTIKERTI